MGLSYKKNVCENPTETLTKIKIIGLGGGGCNAINNMIDSGLQNVEFISSNTDLQSLNMSKATTKVQIGINSTKGLGAGADPDVGKKAALEDREALKSAIEGAKMLFITTGMGGGTGTGSAPIVAEIAKELGILTVAIVTKPFNYEGKRMDIAEAGIKELKENVDSLIVIPNERLLKVLGDKVSMRQAFKTVDNILYEAVRGIYDAITNAGLINLDFSDIKNVMNKGGYVVMGSAEFSGEDRARLAAENAISNPLLEDVSLIGAKNALINITSSPDSITLNEINEITSIIKGYIDENAQFKCGLVEIDEFPEDSLRVTVIATNLNTNNNYSKNTNFNIVKNSSEATGTEDIPLNVFRSGRNTKSTRFTAEDFDDPSVVDNFQTPAMIRRQAD